MSTTFDIGVLHSFGQRLSLSNIKTTDLILTLVLLYTTWTIYDVYFGPLSKFPGPKLWAATRFFTIRTAWTGTDVTEMHRLHLRYGPVVRVSPSQLSYSDPAAWKDIYGHKSGTRLQTHAKDPDFYILDAYYPPSVVIADDATHTRHRKILANAFSDKALREQAPLLKRWANMMIKKLKEVEASKEPADILRYYNFTTFDIMSDLTFAEPLHMLEGSDYSPWVKQIFDGIIVIGKLQAIKKIPYMALFQRWCLPLRIMPGWREHDKKAEERVTRRLATDPGRADLWTEVLKRSGSDDASDPTARMSLGEMNANANAFMIAGTETTATLLSGLTYHLLRNADKMAILAAELRNSFENEEDLTVDALSKLPYLNACIEEGLRLYSPVPVGMPRRVHEGGAVIAGQYVPENTQVSLSNYCASHSPANFHLPDSFIPERWLPPHHNPKDNLQASQPFSIGPRNCLGKNLAYHEARLLLTMVVWNFDLELMDESQGWIEQKCYVLWEKKALMVRLKAVRR